MKVSIDGLRKNMMQDLKNLRREMVNSKDDIDGDIYHNLAEKFDSLAQSVNVMMCVFDDNYKDDFSDLSGNGCEYLLDD